MSDAVGTFEPFAAVATASPKEDGSQDRGLTLAMASEARRAVVVVCDGVGAYHDSGAVARDVASGAAEYLASGDLWNALWTLPATAVANVADDGRGATTLLAIRADASGYVGHCLIGNGMLIEIDAEATGLDGVRLRWTEIALPQMSLAAGRPALRSFLPYPSGDGLDAAVGARLITGGRPRLFLACSDGVGSAEERDAGTALDGSVWQLVPRPLAVVLQDLSRVWTQILDEPDDLLGPTLQGSLDRLLADGALDDDATVGAVLLRPYDSRAAAAANDAHAEVGEAAAEVDTSGGAGGEVPA